MKISSQLIPLMMMVHGCVVSSFLSTPRRLYSERATTKRHFFGAGKAKPTPEAGLVTAFSFEAMDEQRTVAWLHSWAKFVVTDSSLYGDEFVFPFEVSAQEDGVTVSLKYIDLGTIIDLGSLDIVVISDGVGGCIKVTRKDAAQATPYIGEQPVIASMLQSLKLNNGVTSQKAGNLPTKIFVRSPPTLNKLELDNVKAGEKILEDWGSSKKASKNGEVQVDTQSKDTRFKAPWQVFLNDMQQGGSGKSKN